ncbi:MAG TPA: formyltransferase family protein [Armatimonadota bacterium]|jgi:methionyl-tRNA formyltransferase
MVERFKIGLMGSLGVAVECLEWLNSRPEFEVTGVVCSREPRKPWRVATQDRDMQEAARELCVPMVSLDELCELRPDIGLSVRFHQILRRRHLDSFRLGVINLHGSILPEMRGSMCDAMAIVENRPEFGASLHWMDEGIDSGALLAEARFPIGPNDTVFDLFTRSNLEGLRLIKESLADIAAGRIEAEDQADACARRGVTARSYRASDVMSRKDLRGTHDPEYLWNIARAFQFPGYPPATIVTRNGRINLTIDTTDGPA